MVLISAPGSTFTGRGLQPCFATIWRVVWNDVWPSGARSVYNWPSWQAVLGSNDIIWLTWCLRGVRVHLLLHGDLLLWWSCGGLWLECLDGLLYVCLPLLGDLLCHLLNDLLDDLLFDLEVDLGDLPLNSLHLNGVITEPLILWGFLHTAVKWPVLLQLKHFLWKARQCPCGWLYPHLLQGCLVLDCTSAWMEDLLAEADARDVRWALPCAFAYWNCSHLASNCLQWARRDWYISVDWSCKRIQSLASWYFTACCSTIIIMMSLTSWLGNWHLAIVAHILLDKACTPSSGSWQRSEKSWLQWCQKWTSLIMDWIAFNACTGVCWASGVTVLLSTRVWSAWQSSLSNIILICVHPHLCWSAASGSMSRASRKSKALVLNACHSAAWFGLLNENLGASQWWAVDLDAILYVYNNIFQKN